MTRAHTTDVLVLGAGAAGLAASSHLVRAGHEVAIVEARDRIGGRVDTLVVPDAALPIERGAEFVHGDAKELEEILAAARLPTCEVRESHARRRGGKLDRAPMEELLDGFVDDAERASKKHDVSIARVLSGRPREEEAILRTYLEGFHGASLEDFGARGFVAEERGSGDAPTRRILGGYRRAVDALAAPIDARCIHLGLAATRVRWSRGDVSVETKRACEGAPGPTFHARRIVVTLPLGVLLAGDVAFEPALDRRWGEALAVAPIVRAVMRFRSIAWDPSLAFVHVDDAPFPTLWTPSPIRAPLVTAWAGGPAAARIADVPRAAIESFARAFAVSRGVAEEMLERVEHHDWNADPFARGAYAYARVGGVERIPALVAPIEGTIFFAGEHTSIDAIGTVHGAIASGLRAAGEIRRSP